MYSECADYSSALRNIVAEALVIDSTTLQMFEGERALGAEVVVEDVGSVLVKWRQTGCQVTPATDVESCSQEDAEVQVTPATYVGSCSHDNESLPAANGAASAETEQHLQKARARFARILPSLERFRVSLGQAVQERERKGKRQPCSHYAATGNTVQEGYHKGAQQPCHQPLGDAHEHASEQSPISDDRYAEAEAEGDRLLDKARKKSTKGSHKRIARRKH